MSEEQLYKPLTDMSETATTIEKDEGFHPILLFPFAMFAFIFVMALSGRVNTLETTVKDLRNEVEVLKGMLDSRLERAD
jgi:hypothetical protein